MSISPLASADFDKEITTEKEIINSAFEDLPIKAVDETGPRIINGASGRAPCSAVQTDAGTAGDTGNTSTTAKSLGTDPTNGPTGVTGCVDASDKEDWYGVTTTAGKEVDVELVVPSGADFDLYLVDATGTTFYDYSEYNDPLESVTSGGTALEGNATTFYIFINAYSGDGTYTLRVWTNNTTPKPDLTITSISHPAKAEAGDTVNVTYSVSNLANNTNASSGAFDVLFILSTDDTYGFGDQILDEVEVESDLAAGSSRTTTTSIVLPANLTNDSYHWIVWPDGYNNITESDDLTNTTASKNKLIVGRV